MIINKKSISQHYIDKSIAKPFFF